MTARWRERWPRCRPVGHELRCCARATWVRFHTLPGSKRYAEDDSEYAEILRRHHVLLSEMPQAGELDPLLRLVADDQTRGVIIAPPDLTWLYHPYDGGADVIARYKGERDMLMRRHRVTTPGSGRLSS